MKFDKKIYEFGWKTLIRWLTPVSLRMGKLMALLNAAVSALVAVYARFMNLKIDTEYDLTITPQVVFLQKMLNDKFDYEERRITLADGSFVTPPLLALPVENAPLLLALATENAPLELPTPADVAAFTNDFVVNVPALVAFDMAKMKALIDKYKLPGRAYNIVVV